MTIMSVLFLILFTPTISDIANAESIESIRLAKSGLVASDSLSTGDTSYWTPWGSTVNTPLLREYYEDSQGLHIGVQSPYSGKWVNYGAVSPATDAYLFHGIVTNPYTFVSDGVFESGFYVVSSSNSNFIGCIAVSDYSGHYWSVIQTYGSDVIGSGIITTLYQSPLNTEPLTQECTIITNGDNYLRVYLNETLVVSRDDLLQKMPSPFKTILQVDASSPTMHTGSFLDYYATSSDQVIVTNAFPSGTVKIVSTSNDTIASVPVESNGIATISVGMHSFPIEGHILVYDSNSTLVATTPNPVKIFGGDMYSYNQLPQPPTELVAKAVSNSQIDLTWHAPIDNDNIQITGYQIERSHDDSAWTVITNTSTESTEYSDKGLIANTTYTYRVSTINDVGISSPSNSATSTTKHDTDEISELLVNTVKLDGTPIEGIYIQLYQNDTMIGSGYSPTTFTLFNDEFYTVIASEWIGYSFDHWSDDGSTNSTREITISLDTMMTAVYKTLS